MPVFTLSVKWGKELFKDVECNTDEPPLVFKAQLFALSSVQPERQKILIKGQTVGDLDWSNVAAHIKSGITLMMMGSVDKLLEAPVKQTQFMEDMSEAQLSLALDLPVGLKNLGNTCYLNAVAQCLKVVPELSTGLKAYKNTGGSDMSGSLVVALRDTYVFMDKNKHSDYEPIFLVQLLRTVFPQFATMGEHGPQQQDANECLTELLRVLQQKLPRLPSSNSATNGASGGGKTSLIDQYFSGEFACTWKCDESPEEPVTESTENFLQLSCFISPDVKYLHTGLKLRLEEHLTKNSTLLNRNADFTKTNRIKRLPAYLCIQLVRFFYKEKEKISAKVLKDVKFNATLDVYDLCTSDLQKKLAPMREHFRVQDETKANAEKKAKKLASDGVIAETDSSLKASGSEDDYAPFSFEDDQGSNNAGLYELIAVLTHKGRSSNSGHYVGWSKNQKTGQWFMFDDETVSEVTEEDILKLSGGGDWHTAYVLFYGPRRVEKKYMVATAPVEAAAAMTIEEPAASAPVNK